LARNEYNPEKRKTGTWGGGFDVNDKGSLEIRNTKKKKKGVYYRGSKRRVDDQRAKNFYVGVNVAIEKSPK